MDLGAVDLSKLDANGLLLLAQYIGIVPIGFAGQPITEAVLRKQLEEHAMSA
jgi:hypothetical protein